MNLKKSASGLLSGATALTAFVLLAAAIPANAGPVNLDFGTIGANGGPVCGSDCVIPPGLNSATFTFGGATVLAAAYQNNTLTPGFLTQKPGPFGPETGLGESDSSTGPTDPGSDFEIGPGKFVLLDNGLAMAAGFTPVSVSVGSIQGGEGGTLLGAAIFGGVDLNSLTLIATITNPPPLVTQTFGVPAGDRFIALRGDTLNIVLVEEVFNAPLQIPEPASLALLATGLLGLGFVRRRSR